jgi:hypothetical protein
MVMGPHIVTSSSLQIDGRVGNLEIPGKASSSSSLSSSSSWKYFYIFLGTSI